MVQSCDEGIRSETRSGKLKSFAQLTQIRRIAGWVTSGCGRYSFVQKLGEEKFLKK